MISGDATQALLRWNAHNKERKKNIMGRPFTSVF